MWVQALSLEDPLEKEMATHSSGLAWKIPWTEGPVGVQSAGLQRVGRDRMTEHSHNKFLESEFPKQSGELDTVYFGD